MQKGHSAEAAKRGFATTDDVARILGNLDPTKMLPIMALRPTILDIEEKLPCGLPAIATYLAPAFRCRASPVRLFAILTADEEGGAATFRLTACSSDGRGPQCEAGLKYCEHGLVTSAALRCNMLQNRDARCPRSTQRPIPPTKRMKSYRQRMRAAGLRPVQIWVPDTRAPDFVEVLPPTIPRRRRPRPCRRGKLCVFVADVYQWPEP